jgi:hypothetical protein
MTRPSGTKLTPEVARDLCQRTGSEAYISGAIGRLGTEYVLGLKAVNCLNGDTLAEEQVTATSKEKVLDALGGATSKLRGELGESLATVQKFDVPLRQSTTYSLEALKAYSNATAEKAPTAALPYDQRAIQLDPNFAMAYRAWARTTPVLASKGELTSISPRLSSCGNTLANGKSWRSLRTTIRMQPGNWRKPLRIRGGNSGLSARDRRIWPSGHSVRSIGAV